MDFDPFGHHPTAATNKVVGPSRKCRLAPSCPRGHVAALRLPPPPTRCLPTATSPLPFYFHTLILFVPSVASSSFAPSLSLMVVKPREYLVLRIRDGAESVATNTTTCSHHKHNTPLENSPRLIHPSVRVSYSTLFSSRGVNVNDCELLPPLACRSRRHGLQYYAPGGLPWSPVAPIPRFLL